jgi:2-polyprenyl-6-methoxyphenol hydroxylase-like FAD-dependent oxidoreductase
MAIGERKKLMTFGKRYTNIKLDRIEIHVMLEDQTDVLVVGAGPVGLLTALILAEKGIKVQIIDREERTTARSYACGLHPHSLELLHGLGLAADLVDRGKRLTTLAFYDGHERQAQVDLQHLGGEFPFLLVLPQNVLEEALEKRLARAGVAVHWNHRFDGFQPEEEGAVTTTIEELGGTGTGYIVPHWEMVVIRRRSIRARFLVGADGANSLVRQRCDIAQDVAGPAQFFAAIEFESDSPDSQEVRVVVDDNSTNVFWPLPGNKFRWTFQILKHEPQGDFPEKERRASHYVPRAVDEAIRHYLQHSVDHRAPWFGGRASQVLWCTEVAFEPRVARKFGRGRSWLAGDAAHQAGPVGAQSMNMGLTEAQSLAGRLEQILQKKGGPDLLQEYEQQQLQAWRQLLGLAGGLNPTAETSPWVAKRRQRLLACLPAHGEGLGRLASQIHLTLASGPAAGES